MLQFQRWIPRYSASDEGFLFGDDDLQWCLHMVDEQRVPVGLFQRRNPMHEGRSLKPNHFSKPLLPKTTAMKIIFHGMHFGGPHTFKTQHMDTTSLSQFAQMQ